MVPLSHPTQESCVFQPFMTNSQINLQLYSWKAQNNIAAGIHFKAHILKENFSPSSCLQDCTILLKDLFEIYIKSDFSGKSAPPVELVRLQVEQTSEVRLFHRKPNSAGKIGSGGENLAHPLPGQPQVPRSKVTHPRGQLWRASTGSPSRTEQSWP